MIFFDINHSKNIFTMNYYKVNRLVAEELNLTTERNRTKDGAYILWYADINRLGSMADIGGIMRRIGGLVLSPNEARNELYGVKNTPLPVAEDERYILPQDKVNNSGTPAEDMKPDETNADADNAESMANTDNGVEGAGGEVSTDEDGGDADADSTETSTEENASVSEEGGEA